MLRASRNITVFTRLLNRCYFSDDKNDQKSNLVPVIIDNQKNFYKNIYGIELQKHILPYNQFNCNWGADDIKQHRKKMSNYVVILINKVMEKGEQIKQNLQREDDEEKTQDINQKFYKIATYCRVRYLKNVTNFQGLYRVKIDKIEQIKELNADKDGQTIKNAQEDESKDQNEDDQLTQSNTQQTKVPTVSIPNALAGRRAGKIKINYYSLEVSKYEDQPLQLSHINQINFKSIIGYYTSLYPNLERKQNFSLFNPHQMLINTYLIAQRLSNQNSKIKQIQQILQQKDIDQKLIIIQKLLQKTSDWKYVFKQIQKIVEQNFRNKKFYQWYLEVCKVAKQNIDGKKGKQCIT